MRITLLAALLLLSTGMMFGQFTSTAAHIGYSSTLPATCNPLTGDVHFVTAAGPVGTPYYCSATNTWSTMAGSSGSGTVTSITGGFCLTGGTITTSGTIAVDTANCPSDNIIQNNTLLYLNSATGTTSYVACPSSHNVAAIQQGQVFWLVTDTSSTAAATLNICGLSPSGTTLALSDGTTAVGTAIIAGQMNPVYYDGTVYRLLGGAATVKASTQFEIPYYASAGVSNLLTGSSLVQTNNTLFTVGLAPGSADYQVQEIQVTDSTSASPPACGGGCTTGNNTATTFLLNVGSVADSVMPNLYPQRVGIQSMLRNGGSNGVGKALVATAVTDMGDAIGLQTNALATANAAGLIAIGTDDTCTDAFQAAGSVIANSAALQNCIGHEADLHIINTGTVNAFAEYINIQAALFQPPGMVGLYMGLSNGTTAAGQFVRDAVPAATGIQLANGSVSGVGLILGSNPSGASGVLSTNGAGTGITSTSGSDFSTLWGNANVNGSTVNFPANIDQIYISGGTCATGTYTLNDVVTATTATLATSAGASKSGCNWSMVGPSMTLEFVAQNGPNTCTGNCTATEVLTSSGSFQANSPTNFVYQIGGSGSGVTYETMTANTHTFFNNPLVTSVTGGSGTNYYTVQAFAGSPTLLGQNAQGTAGSPTATTTANALLTILGEGYNTSTYAIGASLSFNPTQTWTAGANGAQMIFQTTPNGSTTQATALTLAQDQSATFTPAAGTQGASVSTGTAAGTHTVSAAAGGAGGATSGTGGAGSDFLVTTGTGGAATAGSTTGRGGNAVFTLGSAGGTGTAGAPGQFEIVGGTVAGANTTPFLNITGIWNTTGVVDAAIYENIQTTAEGAASKLIDLAVNTGGGPTSEFSVTYQGNVIAGGQITASGALQAAATSAIQFGSTRSKFTSSADQALAITGSAGGNIGVASASSAQSGALCIGSTGIVTYDPSNTCLMSSRTFKHAIYPVQNADFLYNLNPVSFVYNETPEHKDDTERRYGLIAEDVEKVAPQLVVEGPDGSPLTVKYLELIPLLIQTAKDQQAEIIKLQSKINALEAR